MGLAIRRLPLPIKKWQANSVFEAARCFETMKMVEQARKSYKELIEKYPESDKVADGKARLQALGADGK